MNHIEALKSESRHKFSRAVKNGQINKPSLCSRCKQETPSKRLHGHHHDYTKPFYVYWLCSKCHNQYHAMQKKILAMAEFMLFCFAHGLPVELWNQPMIHKKRDTPLRTTIFDWWRKEHRDKQRNHL